jgi:hypothetical protein
MGAPRICSSYFLFFSPVQRYAKYKLETHCLNANVYLSYHHYYILHIKPFFSQWMQVLPRERKPAPAAPMTAWYCTTLRTVLSHSKPTVNKNLDAEPSATRRKRRLHRRMYPDRGLYTIRYVVRKAGRIEIHSSSTRRQVRIYCARDLIGVVTRYLISRKLSLIQ